MRLDDYKRRRKRYLNGGSLDPDYPYMRVADSKIDSVSVANNSAVSTRPRSFYSGTGAKYARDNPLRITKDSPEIKEGVGPGNYPSFDVEGEGYYPDANAFIGKMNSFNKGLLTPKKGMNKKKPQKTKDYSHARKAYYGPDPSFAQKDKDDVEALMEASNPAFAEKKKKNNTPIMMRGVEGYRSVAQEPEAEEPEVQEAVSNTPAEPAPRNSYVNNPRVKRRELTNPDTIGDATSGLKSKADVKKDVANSKIEPSVSKSSGTDWGSIAENTLQFLPDMINFATGVFGKDKTRPATRVNKSSISKMPENYNVNPVLEANSASYRAILSDPNATMNQKLAALSAKQRADGQIYAEKVNQENRMRSDKARIEANLDSQQARYDESHRQDKMASEANLGLDGNFARTAMANASTKGLSMIAQKNAKKQNEKALAALLSGVDEAVQKRILEAINE